MAKKKKRAGKKGKIEEIKKPETGESVPAEAKEDESEEKEEEVKAKKFPAEHLIIGKSDDKSARWYVVHTYSGHEVKVATALKQRVETMNLENRVLEILIPTQEKIEIRSGKKEKVKEKIFPGYLLIKMILDDHSWLAVRTTQGITGFVGVGNKPTPIGEEEVNSIQKFMAQPAPKFRAKFSVGEAVKIIDGPFVDFLGSVDSIDEEKGKVRVLVSIFGRETPVELDFLQVAKI